MGIFIKMKSFHMSFWLRLNVKKNLKEKLLKITDIYSKVVFIGNDIFYSNFKYLFVFCHHWRKMKSCTGHPYLYLILLNGFLCQSSGKKSTSGILCLVHKLRVNLHWKTWNISVSSGFNIKGNVTRDHMLIHIKCISLYHKNS